MLFKITLDNLLEVFDNSNFPSSFFSYDQIVVSINTDASTRILYITNKISVAVYDMENVV